MTDWQLKLQSDHGTLQILHQGGDKVIEIYTSTPKRPKAELLMSIPLGEAANFFEKLYSILPAAEDE